MKLNICESCEQKNDVIVALQHVIRELRHELVIARVEAELNKGNEVFAPKKAGLAEPKLLLPGRRPVSRSRPSRKTGS